MAIKPVTLHVKVTLSPVHNLSSLATSSSEAVGVLSVRATVIVAGVEQLLYVLWVAVTVYSVAALAFIEYVALLPSIVGSPTFGVIV